MDFVTLALCKKASGGIIPTKVSDLTNDAGYVTSAALNGYAQQSAVDTALAGKQDNLTFDNEPTAGSNNMVKSGAVAGAIADAITNAFAGISQFSVYKCGSGEYDTTTLIPTVASPDSLHIYLVPDSGNYREYIYVNNGWDLIGTTEIDLTGYVQEEDLEDYVKAEDLPAVPTKVSELTNDAGFITKPRTTALTIPTEHSSPSDKLSGIIGGTDVYMAVAEPTQAQVNGFLAAFNSAGTVYLNVNTNPQEKVYGGEVKIIGVNAKESSSTPAPAMGMDIDDATKPLYLIVMGEDELAQAGYSMTLISTEAFEDGAWKLFFEGEYLTEHQSLAGYAKTADVNTALAGKQNTLQFDDAPVASSTKMLTSGKIYNALQGKQDVLTFDDTPTANSAKPVKSGGVKSYVDGKVPAISTNISTDAASNTKTASPKAVKTYVDGAIPTNLVTGKDPLGIDTAYTLKISRTAPASGTANTVITIVVE